MRRAPALTPFLGLLSLVLAARVEAQPAEPETTSEPGEDETDEVAPRQADEPAGDALEDYAPPSQPSEPEQLEPEARAEPAPAPPIGPPHPDEQMPGPVPVEPPETVRRSLVVGVAGGSVSRSAKHDRVDYGASSSLGPFLGFDPVQWLRVTLYSRFEWIPVDVAPGGFDTESYQYPDTNFEQESLDSIGLGLRVEPSLALTDTLKVMLLLDLAWNRFTAAAPLSRGETQVRTAERAGVNLNPKAGVGIRFEPLQDWLELSASAAYGWYTNQSGTAFDDVLQGIDQTGNIVHLAPLPEFSSSFELLVWLGVIL